MQGFESFLCLEFSVMNTFMMDNLGEIQGINTSKTFEKREPPVFGQSRVKNGKSVGEGIQKYPIPHVLDKFHKWVLLQGDKVFLRQPVEGQWIDYTWRDVQESCYRLSAAIESLNLAPGSRISIFSKNCAHWIIADFAIWMSGHVSVPLFPTQTPEIISHILDHADVKVVFVGKLDHWKKYENAFKGSALKVSFPFWNHGPGVESYSDFCQRGQSSRKPFVAKVNKTGDIATIVYSSGTTGKPKGVVHTFQSLNFAGFMASQQGSFNPGDRMFSFLPLGHVVERTLVELAGTFSGLSVAFADNLETFTKDLQTVRPTIFTAVPRIWANIQTQVFKKFSDRWIQRILKTPVISKLFIQKVKKILGLNECRWFFTGGGAMAPSITHWFRQIGIIIREGYGLTENMGYAHFSLGENVKPGFVGKALPGVKTVLSENSEILIQSDANMLGYYLDPVATKECFVNGFLRTGDCGEIDAEGQLRITGRIKEIFKTSKGKYISPSPIEQKILHSKIIENVCVMGSGFAAPVALVQICLDQRKNKQSLIENLKELLKTVNQSLESHEKLKHIVVISEPWTIDNGFMTPTLKNKRNVIEKKYDPWLENHFGRVEDVCFEDMP
jgi:long-chain acyl-CoA synthetase